MWWMRICCWLYGHKWENWCFPDLYRCKRCSEFCDERDMDDDHWGNEVSG